MIEEPLFPGLTFKTILNEDVHWNNWTLYIKLKLYSTLCKVHYLLKLPKAFSL
jgi:hypothetical protein